MKGIQLAQLYYESVKDTLFAGDMAACGKRCAVGLVGEGSDCFGFDDPISRDHDWGPGFCVWLSDADFAQYGQILEGRYRQLPHSFAGFVRTETVDGGGRVGVSRTADFYRRYTGAPEGPRTLRQWRVTPEEALATATNGVVFFDGDGAFSLIRNRLLEFYPEDVRIKKIMTRLARLSQAGQYNLPRCVQRQDYAAARFALDLFIKNTCSLLCFIHRIYMPYYKWMFQSMHKPPYARALVARLQHLCEQSIRTPTICAETEAVCGELLRSLRHAGLTEGNEHYLLAHCEYMRTFIVDEEIRALPIMQE